MEKELSGRIAELREARGLTQSRLAARMGTSQSAISQIEAGERVPSFATLVELAKALEVDMGVLLGMEPQELSDDERIHFRNLKMLDDESKSALLDFAKFLVTKKQAEP